MTVTIAGRILGDESPPWIIAEAGVNHGGDVGAARALIDAGAAAGADAIKFQTFRAEDLVSADAPRAEYQKVNTGSDASQRALLESLELSDDAFAELAAHCESRGVMFLSSPHTDDSIDLLAPLVPAFKIGSGDLTNRLLLERVAAKGKPLLIGTGMATLDEVLRAKSWLADVPTVFLHCTTTYPCPVESANLRAMTTMRSVLGEPVGYSDHTLGLEVPLAAVALGACVIEKHFTLDRTLPGPDHAASATPNELQLLVEAVRRTWAALGSSEKEPVESEIENRLLVRKSLAAARDLPVGTVLTPGDLIGKRPASEISASDVDRLVGSTLRHARERGAMIREEDLQA